MYTLGISAYYHDSSATLLRKDNIVAAAQEERFTRIKNDSSFPMNAMNYCLQEEGITISQISNIVFYENPRIKLKRIIKNHIKHVFSGFNLFMDSFPTWLSNKYFVKQNIRKLVGKNFTGKIHYLHHHTSHLASAFYPSPFSDALIISIDGVGELDTTTIARGSGQSIEIVKRMEFPDSIGLLYSAFTAFCGFKINSGEYKLMGLAPYGINKYESLITDNLVKIYEDGSIKLNLDYFPFCQEPRMFNEYLEKLLGFPARSPEGELTQEYADLAASIQSVIEIIILKLVKFAKTLSNSTNLCLAGGVALNCVANGKLLREGLFENIWIQPAAGDSGTSLGAALHHVYNNENLVRRIDLDRMQGSYLGPEFSADEIAFELREQGLKFKQCSNEDIVELASNSLASGKVVGWFQGRMEFGPRALGNRSILGDPRSPSLQRDMNIKIKFRESFRPFAPSVLEEKCQEYFELDTKSPYMLLVANVKEKLLKEQSSAVSIESDIHAIRSSIPAITHVDNSARVQTVSANTNPLYHSLISAFEKKTGTPLLINTSFNIRGEPIVCSPKDAIKCFRLTNMDALAIGNCFLLKSDNPSNQKEIEKYVSSFDRD